MKTLLYTVTPVVSTRGDMVDQANMVAELDERVYRATIRNNEELAASIVQSRKKEGTYGICDGCGDEIPKARLEAKRDAIRCKECEEKHEAKNPSARHFGFVATRRHAH